MKINDKAVISTEVVYEEYENDTYPSVSITVSRSSSDYEILITQDELITMLEATLPKGVFVNFDFSEWGRDG